MMDARFCDNSKPGRKEGKMGAVDWQWDWAAEMEEGELDQIEVGQMQMQMSNDE